MERIKSCLSNLVGKNTPGQNTEQKVLSNLESAGFLEKIGVSREDIKGKSDIEKK